MRQRFIGRHMAATEATEDELVSQRYDVMDEYVIKKTTGREV